MFSVVVPLYNKAPTIERTLRSVLAQTFQEFEIVVVDDGSTDRGPEIVQGLGDPRIRLVSQPNQGVSVARNRAISESTRPWIALLDGDDEWRPEFLETIRQAIASMPGAGFYGCPSYHHDGATGTDDDATLGRWRGKVVRVDYFENPHVMPHTSAMVLSRDALARVFPDGECFPVGMRCCEDWSCFYRLSLRESFVYVGFPMAVRNNNVSGQITSGISKEKLFELLTDVARFYRITWEAACQNPSKLFTRFTRYDLRQRIVRMLLENDFRSLEKFLDGVAPVIGREFPALETWMYHHPRATRPLAIGYIYFTKLLWRRHGHPITGRHE